ncbi:MAG: hypothetical protein MUF30_13590 [Burkholderiales bacterium]|nr:hypothetical protein [Burkholderiales bacterium]
MRADLLIVGHHGSRTSTTAPFVAAVTPREAWIPVGAANRFGHPHPTVVARLEAAGVRVHRTDRDGALERVLGAGPGVSTEAWREAAPRFWHGR